MIQGYSPLSLTRVSMFPSVAENSNRTLSMRFRIKKILSDSIQTHLFWSSIVVLTIFDWLPDLLENTNYGVLSQITRLLMIGVWALYLKKHFRIKKRIRFTLEFPLIIMVMIITAYALLEQDPIGGIYYTARIAYWVIGVIVIYRLTYHGAVSEQIVIRYVNIIALISVVLTYYFFHSFYFYLFLYSFLQGL